MSNFDEELCALKASYVIAHTGENRENIFLKFFVFLQNSDFFLKMSNFWEKNFRILEKNTNFEKNFLNIFPNAHIWRMRFYWDD